VQPQPADQLAGPLRWLGRAVVVVVALWFIANGLREQWSAAGTVATVLVWVGIAVGVVFVVVGLLHLARRGSSGAER
jgi:hypothetical protein